MPIETKRFRHSRQATNADREAAKTALERAEMSVEEAERHLNKFSDKWSVRDCRSLMAQAGMAEEEIDAACPLHANDRVRVTLTFTAFTEDGETATVNDASGNTAEIPVSSILQNSQDSIDLGDTVPCELLREVWENSGLVFDGDAGTPTENMDSPPPGDTSEVTPEEPSAENTPVLTQEVESGEAKTAESAPETTEAPESIPLSMFGHNVHRRGRDTIEVSLPLTNAERLELAEEMADALAERDRLESEFNAVKKDYKTRIDLQVNLAAQAGETYRAGERTQTVSCDQFEDRTTGEIVWVDSVSHMEVKRRYMTFEERHQKLPGMDSYMEEAKAKKNRKKPKDDTPAELSPDTARTCVTCGNRDTSTDAMPEPCTTCSQIDSGDTDNWTPVHECATCTNVTTRVNMPPCAGCSLNADEAHRGKKEAWEWSQQATPAAQDEASPDTPSPDAPLAARSADAVLPDMPCTDDGANDEAAQDERSTPDELDDIPPECIPQDDDAMPTLPPIGDGHGAGRSSNGVGRSGTEVRQ